jgi:hypothetical protein
LPCTTCNKIVCRNCFGTKYRSELWEQADSIRERWICPSCQGTCPCPRCKKKPTLKLSPEDFKGKIHTHHESSLLDKPHFEKLKPKVKGVVLAQLEELMDREKRADSNVKEMEKLLYIMKREKDDIYSERCKLESIVQDIDQQVAV